MSERDDVGRRRSRHRGGLHRDHAGAVLRAEGDRAVHPGLGPARRRRHAARPAGHPRHPGRGVPRRACACARSVRSRTPSAPCDELDNRWAGTGSCIERWEPTGEPDVPFEKIEGAGLSDAKTSRSSRSRRRPSYRRYPDSEPALLMGLVNAAARRDRARAPRRSTSRSRAAATTCRACRSRSSATWTRSARGRPSTSRTSRWTARGRCSRAWCGMQVGDIDIALVAGSGKSSPGRPREIFPLQTDPVLPRAARPRSRVDGGHPGAVPARRRQGDASATSPRWCRAAGATALANPYAQVDADVSPDELLKEPYYASPLRKHDLPPISDGAAVVLIARGDARARSRKNAGLDPRHRPPHREAPPGPARSHRLCRGLRTAAKKLAIHDGADRRRGAVRALQPRGDRAARGARPRPRDARQPVGRSAVRASR